MESTRVGHVGNSPLQIHLKKKLEMTREVIDAVNVDRTKRFFVCKYNPNSDKWINAKGFDTFKEADERFTNLCRTNGLEADRLGVGVPEGESSVRVVR